MSLYLCSVAVVVHHGPSMIQSDALAGTTPVKHVHAAIVGFVEVPQAGESLLPDLKKISALFQYFIASILLAKLSTTKT